MNYVPIDPSRQPNAASEISPRTELEGLQAQINELRDRLWNSAGTREPETIDEAALSRLVKKILRLRRRRENAFGNDLFGEPAWDMLLEMYAAEQAQHKLSVSGTCYASAVPPSTALRWIVRLEKEGWVRRIKDPADGRRSWVVLTDRASQVMRDYLSEMAASHF
jgi:DNA-binding MarR family transcriptional regulator